MMTDAELRELDRAVAEHEGLQHPPVTEKEIAQAAFSCLRATHPDRSDEGSGYTDFTFDIPEFGEIVLRNKGSKYGYKGTGGNDGYGLWLWEQREGRPWQAALEKTVSAYRKKPKPYSTDWSAAGPLLEKYGLGLSHDWTRGPSGGEGWTEQISGATYEASPLVAICKAVLSQPTRP